MLNRREFAGLAVAGATTSLSATTAVAAEAEAEGTIAYHVLASSHVPGEPGVAIYAPPGYDAGRAEPYPLLLLLHGGNGTEKDLAFFKTVFDNEIAAGRLPPLIIATPSGRRSLYMDFRDGAERWESFILFDVLPFLRRSAHVSRGRELTFIGGWSMGGLGSLRIAFKHPELFAAVAALEPAVEPAVEWKGVGPHTRFWRPEEVLHPIFGNPVDGEYWMQNNPASIASRAPDRLLGLGIYLEVGDQDMLYLYEGAEFLHRVLFDARLAHEYRLVHGAEHIGPSLLQRMADALGFIARQISPPGWIDQNVLNVRAVLDGRKRSAGLPVGPVDPGRVGGR